MVGTSTVVMFGLMCLNTYQLDHVFFSEPRAYMALVMGATMSLVMLAYMIGMYKNTGANLAIIVGSLVVCGVALWLVRSEATVDDAAWMKAMIPHHSIAILTSERANISDPRVRKLADQIIESQRREIEEMRTLIHEPREQVKANHGFQRFSRGAYLSVGAFQDLGLRRRRDQRDHGGAQPRV